MLMGLSSDDDSEGVVVVGESGEEDGDDGRDGGGVGKGRGKRLRRSLVERMGSRPHGGQVEVEFIDVDELVAADGGLEGLAGGDDGDEDADSADGGDDDRDAGVAVNGQGATGAGSDQHEDDEDGEIEEDSEDRDSEGELEGTVARREVQRRIGGAIAAGGKDVAQKDARYFMMDNVVCGHCGVKGHLSFDCPEEADETRCFLCGKPGHNSRECPDEACFHCGKPGHKLRDCPARATGRSRFVGASTARSHTRFDAPQRMISAPRPPVLFCYVCGADGHLDCSLARQPAAVLSCHNCGQQGHTGNGCAEERAERYVSIVNDLDRERRNERRGGRGGRDGRGGRGGGGRGRGKEQRKEKGETRDKAVEARAFRDELIEKVRARRNGGSGRRMAGPRRGGR